MCVHLRVYMCIYKTLFIMFIRAFLSHNSNSPTCAHHLCSKTTLPFGINHLPQKHHCHHQPIWKLWWNPILKINKCKYSLLHQPEVRNPGLHASSFAQVLISLGIERIQESQVLPSLKCSFNNRHQADRKAYPGCINSCKSPPLKLPRNTLFPLDLN